MGGVEMDPSISTTLRMTCDHTHMPENALHLTMYVSMMMQRVW